LDWTWQFVLNFFATFGSGGCADYSIENFGSVDFFKSVVIVCCICLNVEACVWPAKHF